jgi:hypothetical protein
MFNKVLKQVGLARKLPPLPAAHPDRCLGDRQAKTLKLQLGKGEWRAVRDTLSKTRDAGMRSFLIGVAADSVGNTKPGWVDEWSEAHPNEALTWTVRGALSFDAAGKARGGAKSVDTTDQQWGEMGDLMSVAQQQLNRAMDLDPSDPVPCGTLLWIAIAANEPPEVRQQLYDEARHRAGGTWFALDRTMLTGLTKKWGGSHEQMFAFARTQAGASKQGTAFPALIIEAHYERMLYSIHWEHAIQKPSEYFARPALKNEIVGVAEKVEGLAGPEAISVANFLSFAFWAMGDLATAHRWLQRTQAIEAHPWTPQLRALATKQVNAAVS